MNHEDTEEFTIALSPQGELYLLPSGRGSISDRIRSAFASRTGDGLKHLGLWELETALPSDLTYWREFSRIYFSHLCIHPRVTEIGSQKSIPLQPPREELLSFSRTAPPMMGGEYLNEDILVALWEALHFAFQEEVHQAGSIQDYFTSRGIAWNLIGRVCFHLAENKGNEEAPFAFLATYSHQLSARGKAQYLPLGKALQEYGSEKTKDQLLQLLLPVQKGSEKSEFLKSLVNSGEIFHPLAWTPQEAYQFLKDIPLFESSGIIVRVPDWWQAKSLPRPQVSVTLGGKNASLLGVDSMLKFSVKLTLNGEQLTPKEIEQILSSISGLSLIRGKWVEIDREKLTEVLNHWRSIEQANSNGEISFIEGMRLLSGATALEGTSASYSDSTSQWAQIKAGKGLFKLLEQLRDPDGNLQEDVDPGQDLQATLRPYQKTGVRWLWFLGRLGLGGCLADDMGLGKTIQVISLFLLLKKEKETARMPSLLIVPASLLGNWQSEIDRFAPSLKLWIAHPSASAEKTAVSREDQNQLPIAEVLASTDVVMSTYGYLHRLSWMSKISWNVIVIDEAQAIKNAGSKQTQAVKALKGRHRIALTGTPVENHLSDLWSLYDFLCPGLLGSAKDFSNFVKGAQKTESHTRYSALRTLVRPYLLRRLKTDQRIITDLPDKTEINAYCPLTKTQAVLYQQSVDELAQKIEDLDGIQRRGVLLSYLMRFKQICNHPSQWLSDGRYQPSDSGKFKRLREICEEISTKQEKVLVFTQFREMTSPLSEFLKEIFGRPGLILHGETPVKKRKERVDAFQADRGAPFFVLSLKAGGTGLNLTAASHVIHFDRWWNPAVEDQATDRAYRIGQKRNVLVHKFVCRGTIEEKINTLISSEQSLSKEILEGNGETLLTELGNNELIRLVSLDIRSAMNDL